jgi:hypothetical protein
VESTGGKLEIRAFEQDGSDCLEVPEIPGIEPLEANRLCIVIVTDRRLQPVRLGQVHGKFDRSFDSVPYRLGQFLAVCAPDKRGKQVKAQRGMVIHGCLLHAAAVGVELPLESRLE